MLENKEIDLDDIPFGDIEDIYSTVEIFGKEYQLPHWSVDIADIADKNEQFLAVWSIIDKKYPGIQRPEAEMLYFEMLRASKKEANGEDVIPEERFIKLAVPGDEPKTYHIKISDIRKQKISSVEFMNATFKFRDISVLEYAKLNAVTNIHLLSYLLQYYELNGNKYKCPADKIPLGLSYFAEEIVGKLELPLSDGTVISGFNNILELFVTGEFKFPVA